MRAVLQRVHRAAVVVDGETVGPDGAPGSGRQYLTITGPASGTGPVGGSGGGPVIDGEIVDDRPPRD